MTHISLFSGIGGLDMAAHEAGFNTVAFVEREPFCQEVLAYRYPGVPIFDDVTTFDPLSLKGIALVSGGFPCQDISKANVNRTFLEGTRSSLWSHQFRIIRGVGPEFVLVENVPAIVEGGVLGTVLGDLASIGFDAFWQVLSCSSVGLGIERFRAFIVASADRKRLEKVSLYARDAYESLSRRAKNDHLDYGRGGVYRPCPSRGVPCLAYGHSARLDDYKAIGNAVAPRQVYPFVYGIAKALGLNPAFNEGFGLPDINERFGITS